MSEKLRYQLLDGPEGKSVSMARLVRMAQTGEITRYSFVREAKGGKWITADKVEGLQFGDEPSAEAAAEDAAPHRSRSDESAPGRQESAAADSEPDSEGSAAERSAEPPGEAVTAAGPRRRFRLWFALITLSVVAIVPAVAWHFFSPTPAERFERFAENAKERVSANVTENIRAKFRGHFQYDVRRTEAKESVISPYRAEIVFWGGKYLAEYRYDYRHGKWVCMGAKLHLGEGKLKVIKGPELRETEPGKILVDCGRY